jgi:hypothetical protein
MDDQDLVREFKSETDKAFQAAFQSEKGGDNKWKAVIEQYGAQPLTDNEKEMLLGSSMKISRGAFPIELRRVYEKIISKYQMQAGQDAGLQQALNGFSMENKVLEYYQKIKPFAGLGDIFKNAATGTAKYSSGLQKEKQLTIKCKNCGAPRLEEMQYDNCLFCGSKLFETSN